MADVSVPSGSKHIVVAETHLNNDTKTVGVQEPHPEGQALNDDANSDKSKSETPNEPEISQDSVEPEIGKDSIEPDVVVDLEPSSQQEVSKEDASPASDSKTKPQTTSPISNHKNVGRCVSDSEIIVDVPSKRKQSITPVDVSYPSTSKQNASETKSAPETSSRRGLKSILKTRSESQIILNMPILNAEKQGIIGKFSNGTSVDDGGITGVRFELETELSGTTNTKRKRKSGRSKEPKIASFVNPAFEQEDPGANYKFADLVEQLLGHGTDDQTDSHPYGRKACRLGNDGRAFMDSGKPMIWFVLMVVMLSAIGGIIFLSETRKRIPVYLTNLTISATTTEETTDFL
ncbi:hypothetical protein LOTGIDRAFT_167541 [Lottia gigantea]|uniref:Uncharacterized protein n=1 Tax=Lottia gigantea TaxID=225164 RepID=V3ZYH4_LOTGI|nr:hypothetical protein LOTGIDRAFT_167541 [Lottia gigantea]ESO86036.1 hypothetical protein LOTGIDRAFT_167541 [Lottia gigantea]